MVLGSDLDHAGKQVHDGLVAAVVAVGQLLDLGTCSLADHLVAEANAEDGNLAQELLGAARGLRELARVTGTVGEEDAVRVLGEDLLRRGVPGHDVHVNPHADDAAQDAELLTAVEGGDAQALARMVECRGVR